MRTMEFDKRTHTYTIEGRTLPSVSEVMSPLSSKYYEGIPDDKLEIARKRGTEVHEAIDDFLTFGTFNPKYIGYVQNFVSFLERENLKVVFNEHRLTNGMYCGTVDLICVDAFGVYHLVDLKATHKVNHELIRVQLCAYRHLCLQNEIPIAKCHVLLLKSTNYSYSEVTPDEETWRKLLSEYANKVYSHKSES